MYLGIEIGGTKLQLGVGADDGKLRGLWRGVVDVAAGPEGIRRQIVAAVPELLAKAGIERGDLRGAGIGFGGPVDDATHTVIKSHQIAGWDNFPLADWIAEVVGLSAVLGNDADVAGLAEALHGAGKGLSPIFYITIGSGIGGGFIINGEIYRGCGRGAAEIGHLRTWYVMHHFTGAWSEVVVPLEERASGWALGRWWKHSKLPAEHSAQDLAALARQGDHEARDILHSAWGTLAEAICHVIALLCPRRIVIGGGVSLMGEKLLFEPLRRMVAERVFKPFAGWTDIVPAALGEEVVVHGAIALARQKLGASNPQE
jgi:glucokinase